MQNLEKMKQKEERELDKRKRQLAKGVLALPVVLILIILAAFVDEIATASGGQIQSSVINEFLVIPNGISYNAGVAMFAGMTSITSLIMFLAPFYRPLADKFGRKIFLAINAGGMGLGMLLCWWSPNIAVFIIGSAIVSFFIQHDMQIVYLHEVVPADKRATIYGLVKGIANLSIVAVPLLRQYAMKNNPELWRNIYIFPILLSIVIVICIIVKMRETEVFLEKRIDYLEEPFEERHPVVQTKSNKKKVTDTQKTGILIGLKHLFKEKQLFAILLTTCCFAMVSPCIYGYVESIMFDFGMETADITKALMLYPFLYAAILPLAGFISDKIGRKKIIVISGLMTIIGFAAFNIMAMIGANPYIIGICYGIYLGFWWTTVDFTTMMSTESVPTYNRGSVAGAGNLVSLIAGILGMALTIAAPLLFSHIGFGYMAVSIPFILIGIISLAIRVRETKGVDLSTIEYENS